MRSLLLSTDSLIYCLRVHCLKAVLQLAAEPVAITRMVSDAVCDDGAEAILDRYLIDGTLHSITLDPVESRLCTRLWLDGWALDLASVAAVASVRNCTLVSNRAEFGDLTIDFPLERLDCAGLLLQLAAQRIISLADADRYLGGMRELGLSSPILAIDPPTLQRWQRHELRL